uniref:Uncharacterized protein n=1 Tax=Timema poppense TaxID=170557 RepID=A0A7R9HB08_TIMPO|nr:unnamed protein product [Timema poppensis]
MNLTTLLRSELTYSSIESIRDVPGRQLGHQLFSVQAIDFSLRRGDGRLVGLWSGHHVHRQHEKKANVRLSPTCEAVCWSGAGIESWAEKESSTIKSSSEDLKEICLVASTIYDISDPSVLVGEEGYFGRPLDKLALEVE